MQDGYATNFQPVVSGQFQPCTSARTNPTPDLTPTPTLWGLEVGRGSRASPPRVSLGKRTAERQASTNKVNHRQDVCCILQVHSSSTRPEFTAVGRVDITVSPYGIAKHLLAPVRPNCEAIARLGKSLRRAGPQLR